MTEGHVLYWGASPNAPSGFGKVGGNIMRYLVRDWTVDVLASSYNEHWEDAGWKHQNLNVRPACLNSDDPHFGRDNLLDYIRERGAKYDVLWILQDVETLGEGYIKQVKAECQRHGISVATYFPIDSRPNKHYLQDILKYSHFCATYTKWGRDLCMDVFTHPELKRLAEQMAVIPHGVDQTVFKPMRVEKSEDMTVYGYVGRNNRRKQIPRDVIQPFMLHHRDHPDTKLLLKSPPNAPNGWPLQEVIRRYSERIGVPKTCVKIWKGEQYVTEENMCRFYNSLDALLLVSEEGWGLPVVEAMACKTLTITADYGALQEVATAEQSVKVRTKEENNYNTVMANDNAKIRNLVDVEDVVDKLSLVKAMNRTDREELLKQAYGYVSGLRWNRIASAFDEVFCHLKGSS